MQREQLKQSEQTLLTAYRRGSILPVHSDTFPAVFLFPDFKDSDVFSAANTHEGVSLNGLQGKLMYQLLVKIINGSN